MGKERRTRVVHYKHVQFNKRGQTLQTMLNVALAKSKTLGSKKMDVSINSDGSIFQMLGEIQPQTGSGLTCAALMSYTPGLKPLYFVDDASAEEVTLVRYAAPESDDGKRRELLESVLFFGVKANHLVVVQSTALRAGDLESYLTWFLRTADALSDDRSFQLVDKPDKKTRDRFTKHPKVRSIKLGAELSAPSFASPPVPDAERNTLAVDVTHDKPGALASLKALFTKSELANLNLDELDKANIEMTVLLRYSRKTTDGGRKLMNGLGAALRNTDDMDMELELVGGGTIKGSDLKLSGDIRITTYDGMPVAVEVYEVIRKWLEEKLESRDIQA